MDPATAESPPDADLVARLLREQAPQFATATPRPTSSAGSSNWVFRLGDTLAVRLPREQRYVEDLRTEARWLPRLAPHLSQPVPQVRHAGEPSSLFARPWTVVSWVEGIHPADLDPQRQQTFARSLGGFVRSLHGVDTADVDVGELTNGYRTGEPVTDTIDAWADEAASDLADLYDPARVREAWRRLRDVPPPTTPVCWVHTDLSSENVLVDGSGALTGVIDFGGLGIGHRSVDLLYAWELLDPPARAVLRDGAGFDEATWLRARAWSFVGPGLVTAAGYRTAMPERTARLLRMVEAVAAEVGIALR